MRITAALCLALCLAATLAAAEGITPAQLLDLEQVRSADLSPDGKLAAYTVAVNRDLDDDAGGAWSRLWVVPTAGGEPRPYVTGEVAVGAPSFSPDGRHLGFTLKRGTKAKTQVWVLPVGGGEALPVTASPTGVESWAWSHDGADIFYVDTDEAPAAERKLKDDGQLPVVFEENLRGRALRRTPFAWGREPRSGEALVADLVVWGIDVAASGGRLAFGASAENLVDQQYMFQDIRILDLQSGEHRLAVDVPGKLGDYRLSPDGKQLAYTAAATPGRPFGQQPLPGRSRRHPADQPDPRGLPRAPAPRRLARRQDPAGAGRRGRDLDRLSRGRGRRPAQVQADPRRRRRAAGVRHAGGAAGGRDHAAGGPQRHDPPRALRLGGQGRAPAADPPQPRAGRRGAGRAAGGALDGPRRPRARGHPHAAGPLGRPAGAADRRRARRPRVQREQRLAQPLRQPGPGHVRHGLRRVLPQLPGQHRSRRRIRRAGLR